MSSSVDTLTESTAKLSVQDETTSNNGASSSTTFSTTAASSSSTDSTASPNDLDVRHPLEHRWTFFFNPPQKVTPGMDWQSNVKTVTSVDTVEDFWRLFNALKAPSQLTQGSNYHMFKDGIQPEWEDVNNRKGGKWTMNFSRRPDPVAAGKMADEAWLHSLLALVGEQYGEDSDDICGIVIAPRAREFRIALWTRRGDDEAACKRIGLFFKQNVGYEGSIGYQLNDESIKKQTSYKNATIYSV